MIDQKLLKIVSIILLLAISFMCCKDDNPTEPQYDSSLVGNWKVSSMSWDGPTESGNYDQSQLDSVGVIWNLNFKLDNTAEQITNLSGATITQAGTWINSGNMLTLNLKAPTSDQIGTIKYVYIIDGDLLKLNWTLGDGTIFDAEFTKQ